MSDLAKVLPFPERQRDESIVTEVKRRLISETGAALIELDRAVNTALPQQTAPHTGRFAIELEQQHQAPETPEPAYPINDETYRLARIRQQIADMHNQDAA
ncbi:MAG TPA: hypothetical protein VGE30_01995 [Candidatus Saccharimonadales bacterium]